jgi:hypothetical protein
VDPICLVVAGVVRATLPDSGFTLAWEHSVQKTRWEERYRVDDGGLVLAEARVQGSGAGMEPPPGAVLRNGWWTWRLGALVGKADNGAIIVVRRCTPGAANRSGGAGEVRSGLLSFEHADAGRKRT